ncbi:MAG: sulfatase-like hydrolase/transferase [Planctomycetota bacterium]
MTCSIQRLSRLLVALVLLFAGCGKDPRPTSVLLITLDTTRADRLGCYGRAGAGTETFDRLAETGVLFEQAYTAAPITLPSHTSILTGTYPTHHGVHDNGSFRAAPTLVTLAEILQEEGYRTGAFIASFPLDSAYGLDQGFETYDDAYGATKSRLRTEFAERPASAVVDSAEAWLSKLSDDEGFFAWVHCFDPHAPYAPPEEAARRHPDDPYQAEIDFMDEQLGRLSKALEASNRLDDTLIVVVADHGESLGEHGEVTHAALIYNPTVRVPLILSGPGVPSSRRITATARTIDILPTVTDLLGLDAPRAVQGRSLQSLWSSDSEDSRTAYLETYWPKLHQGWSPLEGLVDGEWKLIRAPEVQGDSSELFDILADPAELEDLAAAKGPRASELNERLSSLIEETSSSEHAATRNLDEGDQEVLAQLGYVGSTVDEREAGQHPKDRVRALSGFQIVARLIREQRFTEALAKLGEIEAAFPDSLGVLEYGALCYKEMGRQDPAHLEEALDRYRRAIAINPNLVNLWKNRGEVHLLRGELREAADCYEQARELSPGVYDTEKRFALILARLSRTEEAIAIVDALTEQVGPRRDLFNDVGAALERTDHPNEALKLFERAIAFGPASDPEVVRAHNRAGVILSGMNRSKEAMTHFEAVNRVRPDNEFARPRLAMELEKIGEPEKALRIWQALAQQNPGEPSYVHNRDRLQEGLR